MAHAKYLGVDLSRNKATMLALAVLKCKHYLKMLCNTVSVKNQTLKTLICGAYVRSIILYQFTPLLAADICGIKEIEDVELQLYKKFFANCQTKLTEPHCYKLLKRM